MLKSYIGISCNTCYKLKVKGQKLWRSYTLELVVYIEALYMVFIQRNTFKSLNLLQMSVLL